MSSATSPIVYISALTCLASSFLSSSVAIRNRSKGRIQRVHSEDLKLNFDGVVTWYVVKFRTAGFALLSVSAIFYCIIYVQIFSRTLLALFFTPFPVNLPKFIYVVGSE